MFQRIDLKSIFISYRREDSAGHAGRLYDHLKQGLENLADVFLDVHTIEPGEGWRPLVLNQVQDCDILIVVIGRNWLSICGEDGRRRLDNPEDMVRQEIKTALIGDKVNVIPVLVGNATMPIPQALPDDLIGLCERNASEIRDTHFVEDTKKLVEALKRYFKLQQLETAPYFVDLSNSEKAKQWASEPLGDLVEQVKVDPIDPHIAGIGEYPHYTTMGIKNYLAKYSLDGTYLLVANLGRNLLQPRYPFAFKSSGKFSVGTNLFVFKSGDQVLLDYLLRFLHITDVSQYVAGTIPRLNLGALMSIPVLVPPIAEQQRILEYINASLSNIEQERKSLQEHIDALHEQRQQVYHHAFTEKI